MAHWQEPFGEDPNDVAIEKTLRRIDKLSASQLCQHLKRPVTNFNLFPESRTTDSHGKVTNKVRRMGHLSLTAESSDVLGGLRKQALSLACTPPSQKRASSSSGGVGTSVPASEEERGSARTPRVFTISPSDVVVQESSIA